MAEDAIQQPFYPLTSDNHSALVVVAAVIFLIYAIIGVGVKLLIRLSLTSIKSHDIVLLVAGAVYCLQTAFVIVACNHGLGQHRSDVSTHNFDQFSIYLYASEILAVCVNGLTKLSICLLIRHITSQGKLNVANLALGCVVIGYVVVGIFTTAFQCALPSPWLVNDSHECPSRGPIYVFNGIISILTDLALCALPVAMMWDVQAAPKKKLIIMVLFGTRILVPIFTIIYLAKAGWLFQAESDFTWLAVSSSIWYQMSLGLAIITACIPGLKGVIDSLLGSTSVAAIGVPYDLRDSGNDGSGIQITPLRDGPSRHGGSYNDNRSGSNLSKKLGSKDRGNKGYDWSADRETQIKYGGRDKINRIDEGSESVRKLTDGVIVVRDEYEVHYDDRSTYESREGSQKSIDTGHHAHTKSG